MKPHLLFFPCRNATFDWFGEISGSGVPPVTVNLLAEQREYECLALNREQRVYCQTCGSSARYVVCRRQVGSRDKLFPRRFPNSQALHQPGCYSYAEEFRPPESEATSGRPAIIRAGAEFAALTRELNDPEYRIVSMQRRDREQPTSGAAVARKASARLAIGLQRLAKEVLQRSGVCEWRPGFINTRSERVFNGLITGAFRRIALDGDSPAGAVLQSLGGVNFVPWSYLASSDAKVPAAMTACVGFGFIESLGPENEHGGRGMTLRNHPDCPLVVPRRILDREGKNSRSALLSYLAHPTWTIFVAALHGGIWKAHALIAFRVSEIGLIPVESLHEDAMVARLIGEGRAFGRWLLPPPELRTRNFVPDFQLKDTAAREYIEVAGRMASSDYAENIRRKSVILGPRLLIWDTETPLRDFVLPPATCVPPRVYA